LEEVLRYSAPKGRIGGFFAESIQVSKYLIEIIFSKIFLYC